MISIPCVIWVGHTGASAEAAPVCCFGISVTAPPYSGTLVIPDGSVVLTARASSSPPICIRFFPLGNTTLERPIDGNAYACLLITCASGAQFGRIPIIGALAIGL